MRRFLALLLLAPPLVLGAVNFTAGPWKLVRSGTTQPVDYASAAACDAALRAQSVAVGSTVTFRCQQTVTGKGVADAPPPPAPTCTTPQPAAQTQTVQCPTGTTGSWTQTRTYSAAAYPTCWTAGAWTPAAAPAGACMTAPPPPPPPPAVTVSASFSPANIAAGQSTSLVWSSSGATSCSAAAQGQTMALPGTSGSLNVGPQSAPVSVVVTCNGVSATATLVITATPPPPPWTGGVMALSWTASTKNTDGTAIAPPVSYRVTVDGVVRATVTGTSYTATGLSAGPHSATVATISASGASAESNPVSVTLVAP